MLAIRRRNRAQPTQPGEHFHDRSRPLYLGPGKLVDTSVTGRLRSSTYRELATSGYARQRVRFGGNDPLALGDEWYDGQHAEVICQEPDVTIVAAWLFQDAVRIAADSNVRIDSTFDSPTKKLRQIGLLPLVWAGAGENQPIDEFRRWRSGQDWVPGMDWADIKVAATAALASINASKRASMKAAGVRPKRTDLAAVLVAGYADGEPGILELTERGESYLLDDQGYGAIGSGSQNFTVARLTLTEYYGQLPNTEAVVINENLFWLMVAIAAATDPKSKLPLQRCVITRSEVRCVE